MTESRKSDFTGDVFGAWTVLRKAAPAGDRIRRWVVRNADGVEMQIAQTGLKDLGDFLLHQEALASVALDHDSELGTYTLEELNAFADAPAEFEDVVVESENPFGVEEPREVCDESGEHFGLKSGHGPVVIAGKGVTVEAVGRVERADRPEITAALDAVLKAKAALNQAQKLLGGLL